MLLVWHINQRWRYLQADAEPNTAASHDECAGFSAACKRTYGRVAQYLKFHQNQAARPAVTLTERRCDVQRSTPTLC